MLACLLSLNKKFGTPEISRIAVFSIFSGKSDLMTFLKGKLTSLAHKGYTLDNIHLCSDFHPKGMHSSECHCTLKNY